MMTFVTVVHIIVCVFLATIVLLQHGKGADMGASFGGSGQTVFGARGAATLLQKLTAGAAVTFMITSLSLAYMSSRKSSDSLMKGLVKNAVSPTPTPVTSPGATPSATPTVTASATPAAKAPAVKPPVAKPAATPAATPTTTVPPTKNP